MWYIIILFVAKVIDNCLNTAKTLLIQRGRAVVAGAALGLSTFICLLITKNVVSSDSALSLVVVSAASGVGCFIAVQINNKLSREKTFINVIMSDDTLEMALLRDYLAENKISNVISDSYSKDWEKTLTITAYAETKEQSKLIENYIMSRQSKFKRIINGDIMRRE